MKFRIPRFLRDRRGIAATEFALIAPALIFLVMGVLEMSFRFRANEEATRYVHQVADLVSRETDLTTAQLNIIYDASVNMMKPLDTTESLDFDVSSIAFVGTTKVPTIYWRRVAGSPVTFAVSEAAGMGEQNESVIRVGIRYTYESVLSSLFGGKTMAIVKTAYARPRIERQIAIDGSKNSGATISYFGS